MCASSWTAVLNRWAPGKLARTITFCCCQSVIPLASPSRSASATWRPNPAPVISSLTRSQLRRQIPLDQCGRHFGEWLAVGLGEIEDVDDSEADNPAFFIFTVPGVILRVTGARICRPRSFVRTEHLATGSRPGRSAPADTSQPGSPSLPAALTTRSSIPTSWWETGYSGNSRDHHSRRRETKDRRHSLSRPRENDLHAAGVEGRKDRRKEH